MNQTNSSFILIFVSNLYIKHTHMGTWKTYHHVNFQAKIVPNDPNFIFPLNKPN